MTALYMWMFTSKWIKLLGHYIRYPVDVFLLPVSILFGYFHGAIKMYAVMTLNVVSCIPLTTLLFSQKTFSLAGQWRKSERKRKNTRQWWFWLGVGCLSVRPVSSYDTPASQRFDHDSSFVHYPLLFPVRATFSFLGVIHASDLPDAFSAGYIHLWICILFPSFPTADPRLFCSRQLGVAVMALMIMTRSA